MSNSPAIPQSVFGTVASAIGVATQGASGLRRRLGRRRRVMRGMLVLIGTEDERLISACGVGRIGHRVPIAFPWAKDDRPKELRP